MTSRPAPVEPVGIIELGARCASLRAANLDLFEALGAWVVSTADPALQRLFAEAAHRHAWHAELWRERTPSIPPVDADALTADARSPVDGDDAATDDTTRSRRYREALSDIDVQLGRLRDRTEATLDPATDRMITLVAADLADLVMRLEPHLAGR